MIYYINIIIKKMILTILLFFSICYLDIILTFAIDI